MLSIERAPAASIWTSAKCDAVLQSGCLNGSAYVTAAAAISATNAWRTSQFGDGEIAEFDVDAVNSS